MKEMVPFPAVKDW